MELIKGGLKGWRVGDIFCSRDGKHMGAVLRVHEWGLDVLWDDLQHGFLLFDPAAPNSTETVKQVGLHHRDSLWDFLDVPLDNLWHSIAQHTYPDTFPRVPSAKRTLRTLLNDLH